MAELTGANRSSMLQDVEAGRPTEIDAISGAVVREAERHGVAAPMNQAMTLLVGSIANGNQDAAKG
jgi:2-dehydropantoate 2-reductase